MKFKSELDYYQNLRAWRNHYEKTLHTHTKYSVLSNEEKAWLMKLNTSLRNIEERYRPILDAKFNELNARVLDPLDWLMEFNLTYTITFYLRESDPEFEEDDDNILMQMQNDHFIRDVSKDDWGFGATHINHAENAACFLGEQHCYTYHHLYDHCSLDWRDLLRIGSLYFDIHIDEQSGVLSL